MAGIRLVAAGTAPLHLMDRLAAFLARTFRVSCRVSETVLDVSFAYHQERKQYYSTAILERLALQAGEPEAVVLGLTDLDLYVPVLTFVYGEAQLGGPAALVSLHRLHERYYGLPANQELLFERLKKEALHELGHTRWLRHCEDWQCAMASSYSVEMLDLKRASYCIECSWNLAHG